ncbi:universal stress protein [Actinoplanes solisilvae]|uniref:universal stress protein n=1 Tax=Actinoplanes solisilvae TaxID=2486853 RepID=UPI000FD7A538|nr:universal stress protein [Actinoplanes solisilvae]
MSDHAHSEGRCIVVGVDSSHGSKAALKWALAQPRLTGAAVEVVAAWQQPASPVIVVPDDKSRNTS